MALDCIERGVSRRADFAGRVCADADCGPPPYQALHPTRAAILVPATARYLAAPAGERGDARCSSGAATGGRDYRGEEAAV